MASLNKVMIIGNLGQDPEITYTKNNTPVARLNLATSEKKHEQQITEWHRVVLFGKSAEVAEKYLRKGMTVYVEGRIQTNKYTDNNGVEKYSTDIVGNKLLMLGGGNKNNKEELAEDLPF